MEKLKLNQLVISFVVVAISACNPPKYAGSRLKSGVPAAATVTILPQTEAANQLGFVHNHPDAGPENYKISSLTVTVPASSGALTIDAAANKVALPPLKFAISMVATAAPKKLTCQSSGIPMGTSSLACTLEGGGTAPKDPDAEIADYILSKKVSISSALTQVKETVLKGQTIPPAVIAHWMELEKDAKPGGGFHNAQDAITSAIRSWNSSIEGFTAEQVAGVLVNVYRDSSGSSGQPQSGSEKNADQEIAKYLIEQPGAKISEALYFVQTNILNATIPSVVSTRWNTLESNIGGYNGDVEAITGEIRSWNVEIGYNAEDVARKLSQTYN